MIIRKIPYYEFPKMSLEPLSGAGFLKQNFYLSFALPTEEYLSELEGDTVLLQIPGALTLQLINRSYEDQDDKINSMRSEGCFYFKEEKEWILEALCSMCTVDGTYSDTYILRLPLSAPFAKDGTIGLYFDGTWFRFMKDGSLLNENTGLDCFAEPTGEIMTAKGWEIAFSIGNADQVKVSYIEKEEDCNADFYSPEPWNSFAGDVMNFYHDGVYHLIYLRDRRHHGNRNGNGGHDIYQLTSTDLIHWTEQESVAVIDKPWLTYGTGTMLFHNGKYYMVYGFHTERYQGAQEQVECKLDQEKMEFPLLSCEQILKEGKLPAGASYSVSEDGIHFVPSGVLYHPGRNPSTYAMPDGKVRVYAGYMGSGIWESESFEKPFHQTGEDFTFVNRSIMKNSTECPSFFTWNGYQYLVIGFTGYYRSLSQDSKEYVDMAGKEEIYEGLGVPMVTTFGEDRRLIAGWLNGIGWGSVIIHRELIQEENGKLGLKWVPEMIPETKGENLLETGATTGKNCCDCSVNGYAALADLETETSYLLEMTVDPKNASRMGISFEDGGAAVELQLDFAGRRMQMMDAKPGVLAEPIPTSYEVAYEMGETFSWHNADLNIARNSKNFCLADIRGMEKPFDLKILIRYSRKMRSTVLDVQVAQRRTMISVRAGFFPEKASVLSEGEIGVTEKSLKKLK